MEFLSQYMPLSALRRQAKSQLAVPSGSLDGKTVLITGGTGAIGSEATRILVDLGVARLVLGVPDVGTEMATARELAEELKRRRVDAAADRHVAEQPVEPSAARPDANRVASGPDLEILTWELDMASFASVKAFAARAAELDRLDAALMGAGKFNTTRKLTSDGWEETLQIQHLSTALLEVLLIPKLLQSARQHQTKAVLSSVSSFGIRFASSGLNNLPKPPSPLLQLLSNVKDPFRSQQYGRTKLVHLHFVRALSQRINSSDRGFLTIQSVDPGAAKTPMTTATYLSMLLGILVFREIVMCSRVFANACIAHDATHGALMVDYDVVPYPKFMDSEKGQTIARLVWDETIALLGELSPEAKGVLSGLAEGEDASN